MADRTLAVLEILEAALPVLESEDSFEACARKGVDVNVICNVMQEYGKLDPVVIANDPDLYARFEDGIERLGRVIDKFRG